MKLHTLWNSITNRLKGSPEPAPKKTRRPRQPKLTEPTDAYFRHQFKEIDLALLNHSNRIHELEQIEHRRSEREKEMKTNG